MTTSRRPGGHRGLDELLWSASAGAGWLARLRRDRYGFPQLHLFDDSDATGWSEHPVANPDQALDLLEAWLDDVGVDDVAVRKVLAAASAEITEELLWP